MLWILRVVRHTFLWFVPILTAGLVAVGVASFSKQYRVFFPYGLSVAADQGVLVIEREFPLTLGYRYVGTSSEWQRPIRIWNATLAINSSPGSDSELRKDGRRHWLPNTGMFRTKGGTQCSWTSIPIFYPVLILALPSYLAWRGFIKRFGRNTCRACGYDRSGLDAAVPCPECGGVRRA